MSYILEALKKAQAERQIGALPTIHAPTLHGGDDAGTGVKLKKPLWLALTAMALVIVALLALVWRQAGTAVSPGAPAAAPALTSASTLPAPALSTPPLPAQPPAPVAVLAAAVPAVAPAPELAPSAGVAPAVVPFVAVPPASRLAAASASPAAAPSAPAAVMSSARPVVGRAAPVQPAGQAASASSVPGDAIAATAPVDGGHVAAPAEPPVQALRDLPEPIQRAIPPITVGGYIYSKNPADRLLLIDKVLRHEGEELAPGFVLEKLLPRAAIFNYKGYRYRVGY